MVDKRLIKEMNHSFKYVLLSVLVQWFALLCNVAIIFGVAHIIENLLRFSSMESFSMPMFLMLIALLICRFILYLINAHMGYHASKTIKIDLRSKIYNKLVDLGPSYQDYLSTSEIMQVSVEGVDQLEIFFGKYLPQLFYSLLAPLTLFLIIVPINAPSAWILFICVPLIPISIIVVQKFAKKLLAKYWGQYTSLGDSFLENIEGLTTLKIYQADEVQSEAMAIESEHFRKVTMRVLFMQLNSISVMDLVAYGGAGLGVIIASQQFLSGNLSFGFALAIILISSEFFIPLRLLGSYFHIAMNGMAASDKIFELLDLENTSVMNELEIDDVQTIVIEDLNFSYVEGIEILKNTNLVFNVGMSAIVGESGSGKSTLAKLLSSQNKGYQGSIRIDGHELASIETHKLMKTMMLVGHDAYIFKGTIRKNLLLSGNTMDDVLLWEVLERVNLSDFAKSQNGLDTVIDTAGSNLSGGQRQRLGLARALLQPVSCYIFDEATSNIDADSEAVIMKVIQELSQTHIVIVISHRLMNTVDADVIYVIDSGEIVEKGTHDDLVKNQNKYLKLYNTQSVYEQFVEGGHHD